MVCPQDGILLSNEKKRTPEAANTDELKCVMLSERSQTQKAADCVMHFCDILERENPEGQKTAAAVGGRRGVGYYKGCRRILGVLELFSISIWVVT